MTFTEPKPPVPTADESELLLRFLPRQREEVVATADGLADGHLIEETAHHAGHADATRELEDGRKMR